MSEAAERAAEDACARHRPPQETGPGMDFKNEQSRQYARCMRAHGVADYPDPDPNGPTRVGPEIGRDPEYPDARAADVTLSGLLLGLGAVALLVGGIGVADTMVISVLERRAEIGLRRSLGATRGQIRTQFLTESLLLSAPGGLGGVLLGIAVTTGYAAYQSWPAVVPAWASAGGPAATILIGGLAGLYPAIRAARLSPTEALATP